MGMKTGAQSNEQSSKTYHGNPSCNPGDFSFGADLRCRFCFFGGIGCDHYHIPAILPDRCEKQCCVYCFGRCCHIQSSQCSHLCHDGTEHGCIRSHLFVAFGESFGANLECGEHRLPYSIVGLCRDHMVHLSGEND